MPLRRLGLAVLASLWSVATAAAHPTDLAAPPPTTYAAAVRRIRDEVRGVEEARRISYFVDAARHAGQVDTLAWRVPALAMAQASAYQDSALGRVMRTGVLIRDAASAARRAAEHQDAAALARTMESFASLLATLDAYVPKQYVCPMHCELGRIYDRPGSCPVCGMYLQLITSDRYSVDVTPSITPIRPRAPVTLDFQIKDPAGFPATRLQVVHEKLLHLIVVSRDLSRFDHVHPIPGPDGRFSLRYTFPDGGRYVLFHDFTPDSVGMQVVPVEVTVEGAERPAAALTIDDDRPKRVDGIDVELTHTPLLPGRDCSMTFTLRRSGKPVTDLEPYLGVMGHLILISDDRGAFLHSHPLEAQAGSGPSVAFNLRFERTGIYKAWGQFQRHGRVITVPFVVQVSNDGRGGNGPPSSGAANVSR